MQEQFVPSYARDDPICRYDDLMEPRWPEDTNADTRNREYRCNVYTVQRKKVAMTGLADALAFSVLSTYNTVEYF